MLSLCLLLCLLILASYIYPVGQGKGWTSGHSHSYGPFSGRRQHGLSQIASEISSPVKFKLLSSAKPGDSEWRFVMGNFLHLRKATVSLMTSSAVAQILAVILCKAQFSVNINFIMYTQPFVFLWTKIGIHLLPDFTSGMLSRWSPLPMKLFTLENGFQMNNWTRITQIYSIGHFK